MKSIAERGTTRIVVAGGGTGGHVFPGVAVVEAMEAMGTPVECLWIGTGRPVERQALERTGWKYRVLKVRPLLGSRASTVLLALGGLPLYTAQAMRWLHQFRPNVVLGVGGYVSGPVILAARLLNVPAAIHEQNLVPGLANRMASRACGTVFVSFKGTLAHFSGKRVVVTGNPVRKAILDQARRETAGNGRAKKLLILGGSQGARNLNTLTHSAARLLWESGVGIEVMHQSGPQDLEHLRTAYDAAGIPARVFPFIQDMAGAYSWADLVVCRAGAGTVAELTAMGKPAIFIPYPSSAGGHQENNARELSQAGAALYFLESEIGAVRLASEIQGLLEAPERLAAMSKNSRRLARAEAAEDIACMLMRLAGKECSRITGNADLWKGSELKTHV